MLHPDGLHKMSNRFAVDKINKNSRASAQRTAAQKILSIAIVEQLLKRNSHTLYTLYTHHSQTSCTPVANFKGPQQTQTECESAAPCLGQVAWMMLIQPRSGCQRQPTLALNSCFPLDHL